MDLQTFIAIKEEHHRRNSGLTTPAVLHVAWMASLADQMNGRFEECMALVTAARKRWAELYRREPSECDKISTCQAVAAMIFAADADFQDQHFQTAKKLGEIEVVGMIYSAKYEDLVGLGQQSQVALGLIDKVPA